MPSLADAVLGGLVGLGAAVVVVAVVVVAVLSVRRLRRGLALRRVRRDWSWWWRSAYGTTACPPAWFAEVECDYDREDMW